MKNIASRVMYALSGLIYFTLGLLILNNPVTALTTFVTLVSILLLVSGIVTLIGGIRLKNTDTNEIDKGYVIFEGLIVTVLGLMFLFGNSKFGSIVLAYMMVSWFIVISIVHIAHSFTSFTGITRFIGILLNGFLLFFSFQLLSNPILASGSLVWFASFNFIMIAADRFIHVFIPHDDVNKSN